MQSIAVYSRNPTQSSVLARILLKSTGNLLTNNRLAKSLLNNIRLYLTQSWLVDYGTLLPVTSTFIPTMPSGILNQTTNSTSSTIKPAPLHLIIAYSGYSKDFQYQKKHSLHCKASVNNTNILNSSKKIFKNNNNKMYEFATGTSGVNNNLNRIDDSARDVNLFGDDACFVARQKCADVLGVADGVGGWNEIGIDPSKFSFNLMKTCKRLVEQDFDLLFSDSSSTAASSDANTAGNSSSLNSKTPINLLEQSYNTLLESKNNSKFIGSSTACILIFHHDTNLLHTANLGDSGFKVIRNNKIIHRSLNQQHYFNSPYQIAILPSNSYFNVNSSNNNSGLINDSPQQAATSSVELNEGDFIVVATDGLWDNLNEEELLEEISKIKSYLLDDLQKAAQNIARKAIELAFNANHLSPFSLAARRNGINIIGGKPNDVTVLLARVSK